MVSHWCCDCDGGLGKAICSYCVRTHAHQAQNMSHDLIEIGAVLRAQEHLEERLAHCREESMERARRMKARDDKRNAEKSRRIRELEAEAARSMAALEEEALRRKEEEDELVRESEKEAQRRKAEEDELLLEYKKLQESLSKVKLVVPFRVQCAGSGGGGGGGRKRKVYLCNHYIRSCLVDSQ
jgi:hypothetical protein